MLSKIHTKGEGIMKGLKVIGVGLLCSAFLIGCSANKPVENAEVEKPEVDSVVETADNQKIQDLIARFQPIGDMPIPEDNAMTDEKIELGKKLYFDPRLSGNNKQSCASCHSPGAGYGDNLPKFIGFEGFNGPRNSPTIINAGYYSANFWDGRAANLEEQALGPIQAEGEMNSKLDQLVEELKQVPGYVEDFQKVFGEEITDKNIAKAIAAFERTITVTDTKFDRFLAGETDAMNEQEIAGAELFVGKASCISCHAGPTLSDQNYHNLGMEGDEGRFAVTNQEDDKGKFRTSALRGIAHTAPYMHDGSLATLKDVVDYYNTGGSAHPNKDPLMKPLNLTAEEVDALVAFMEAMSGENPKVDTPELY